MCFKKNILLSIAVITIQSNAGIASILGKTMSGILVANGLIYSLTTELKLTIQERRLNGNNSIEKISETSQFASTIKKRLLEKGLDPKKTHIIFSNSTVSSSYNGRHVIGTYALSDEDGEALNGAMEHEISHLENNDFYRWISIQHILNQAILLTSILSQRNHFARILGLFIAKLYIGNRIVNKYEIRADEDVDDLESIIKSFEDPENPDLKTAINANAITKFTDPHPSNESRIIRFKERLWGKDHPEEYAKLMDQREQEDNARKMLL